MRRSISGPVIVIGIGVLFFLNNFYPNFFSWRSLFHFWPFLLIAFGAIRLLEVLADAGHARPIAPSHFSGGGIVFMVLLCTVFWGISKGKSTHWRGPNSWVGMVGESFDFDIQQTLPVTAADARLVVRGLKGNVTLAGDDTSEITVTGHK